MIRAILVDFGGVIAEEGFREGLREIGKKITLTLRFFSLATELVYNKGYVIGRSSEEAYWNTIREKTGVTGMDSELRDELLKRFTIRQEMLLLVQELRGSGIPLSILSDQTNWLDEINQNTPFFYLFDHIFNSYHLHKSKRDHSLFPEICFRIWRKPDEILFVDDNETNLSGARGKGLITLLFRNVGKLRKEINSHVQISEKNHRM